MDYDDIGTTLTPPSTSTTLRLYDIFIPLLGVFIISLNLLVVISSGLLLGKRKIASFYLCQHCYSLAEHKTRLHSMLVHNKKERSDEDSDSRAHPRLLLVSLFLGQQPRSTYLFLGNVGLSDLLTGFAVLFGQLFPRSLRSDLSCAVQMGELLSSSSSSWPGKLFRARFQLSAVSLAARRPK